MYEQMAVLANDSNIKKMLLDIAKEQVQELEKGKEEVKKEVGE